MEANRQVVVPLVQGMDQPSDPQLIFRSKGENVSGLRPDGERNRAGGLGGGEGSIRRCPRRNARVRQPKTATGSKQSAEEDEGAEPAEQNRGSDPQEAAHH